ncbi:membrane or secreted protein [uncultured Pontibacter sp.]|uniref:membrane or secreted protein n=1 Tax=uncultured Pontibacter sp. TaxID=453356 RepID=UPI00261CF922|nr:membrane or secreted protein [uncultured Pontibacter sp.]
MKTFKVKPLATDTMQADAQEKMLEGAWQLSSKATPGVTTVKLVQDGYFAVAIYNQDSKKFIGTYGGTYTASNGKLTHTYEFSTLDAAKVGTTATGTYKLQNGNWQINGLGLNQKESENWKKIDEQSSTSPLAGTWRITGRERDGQMSTMQPGPRKTLKILSGTRFQWIAFNTETKEFSGTGGGTYTANDGKYTEHIEFFSRDSSRVGMQLSFNYEVKDGKWLHSGQSSTGNKINEVWERIAVKR